MSTNFYSNKSIKLKKIISMSLMFEGEGKIIINKLIKSGDPQKGIKDEYEKTTHRNMEKNKLYVLTHSYKDKEKNEDIENSLCVYVDEKFNCEFVRYGMNDVSWIIPLIEWFTDTKIWNEYEFEELPYQFYDPNRELTDHKEPNLNYVQSYYSDNYDEEFPTFTISNNELVKL